MSHHYVEFCNPLHPQADITYTQETVGKAIKDDDVAVDRVAVYFEDACRLHEEAIKEFEEGLRKTTPTRSGNLLRRHGTQQSKQQTP